MKGSDVRDGTGACVCQDICWGQDLDVQSTVRDVICRVCGVADDDEDEGRRTGRALRLQDKRSKLTPGDGPFENAQRILIFIGVRFLCVRGRKGIVAGGVRVQVRWW